MPVLELYENQVKNIMKTCCNCKQSKTLSEFNKAQNRKDGRQTWCKLCERTYRKTEKSKKINYKADCRYRQTEKYKATRNRYLAQHPLRSKAVSAVYCAIRAGKLPQVNSLQCHCGEQAKDYHHPDYAPENWLNVIPVCRNCHRKIHINLLPVVVCAGGLFYEKAKK